MVNYSCRPLLALESTASLRLTAGLVGGEYVVTLDDARAVGWFSDIWLTDPGYADAINYEELSEFFLAWYEKRLPALFPGW